MSAKFLACATMHFMVPFPKGRKQWKNKMEEKIMTSVWTFRV